MTSEFPETFLMTWRNEYMDKQVLKAYVAMFKDRSIEECQALVWELVKQNAIDRLLYLDLCDELARMRLTRGK